LDKSKERDLLFWPSIEEKNGGENIEFNRVFARREVLNMMSTVVDSNIAIMPNLELQGYFGLRRNKLIQVLVTKALQRK